MKTSFKLLGNLNQARGTSYQRYALPLLVTALVAVIAFSMAGCDTLGGGSGNPFVGSWSGTINYQYPVTANITESEWSLRCPSLDLFDRGTYTWSGNTATARDDYGNTNLTATVNGNRLTFVGTGYYAGYSAELTRQ